MRSISKETQKAPIKTCSSVTFHHILRDGTRSSTVGSRRRLGGEFMSCNLKCDLFLVFLALGAPNNMELVLAGKLTVA